MVSKVLLTIASLYWGIHNEGEPQRINIDHFTSGYVLGIKGEDIHLPPASNNTSKIIVAVLDTGVDSTHPALKNVLAGKGYNFVANNEDTNDTHGHGTHISGVIATQVSKNALILPVKVVQTGPNAPIRPQEIGPGPGTALTENVAKGIVYAIQNGAKVINLSLAWPSSIHSKKMDDAMLMAEQNNVLVVASAANDGTSANLFPCIYSNSICVGAHGPDGSFTYFSNYGSMVDILAPGVAILSTWPMNKAPVTFAGQIGYEFRNGTSMAAPFVAGAAAELMARGFSASETKSRILLGTRSTQSNTLYSTKVVGDFSHDQKKESKFSRFGNLDVSHSLEVEPQSLILPSRKARTEIQWNGIDSSINVNILFKNNWIFANNVKIKIDDQIFELGTIGENQTQNISLSIKMNSSTESTFDKIAIIEADELNGTHSVRSIPISFMVNRIISASTVPGNAIRYQFVGIQPRDYSSIRSVVNVNQESEREFFLLRKNEVVLTRKGLEIGRANFSNVSEDKILNLYKINQDEYSLVSTQQDKGESRPSFLIKSLNNKLQLLSEVKLGTDITVLNENFVWKATTTGNSPLWISIGYTPATEKPAYDPWNKKYQDQKMPRIYYLLGKDLHSIKLADDELPLQFLPNGEILITKGNSYFAKYFSLSVDLKKSDQIIARREISFTAFRMLIGLDGTNKVLPLKGSSIDSIVMVGTSTPGNLRATTINSTSSNSGIDTVLKRESTLDSLIQVSGTFSDLDHQYYFVQTHYDMKFFRSNSNETKSTSLNRFSYIPSMFFSRNFFPVVSKDSFGNGIPAIYIPASIANSFVSEIIVGNTKTGEISKPASFHFEVAPDCSAMGNLINATANEPAKQAFICGSELVMIPIITN